MELTEYEEQLRAAVRMLTRASTDLIGTLDVGVDREQQKLVRKLADAVYVARAIMDGRASNHFRSLLAHARGLTNEELNERTEEQST